MMARTTIDLDPSVLRELKMRSAREKKSMGALASELLAQLLAKNDDDTPGSSTFCWKSYDMGAPRVDLEDKDAVGAILDGDERHR